MKKPNNNSSLLANGMEWWLSFLGILVGTLVTRFHKVTEPDHVCWDETHFGKMASWYINRTFFFDVHPPLGKMLIALSGYLTGYDGEFPFDKPGDKYEDVNYFGMRIFCTFLGACIVPFSYLTVWELTKSITAAFLAGLFILCDVGMITLNQYILLDPILLFFVTGSVLGMVKVRALQELAFQPVWWFWLVWTGIMLAGSVSVKFVGLFVVLLAGLYTIAELWELLGDMAKPVSVTLKHFCARALCLIILPCLLYMAFFYMHLVVLDRSGSGDGFYSSAFQSTLKGNSLHYASMPAQLAYGAIITLKNSRTGGGYLHSHWHLYPEGVGARQQQITTYTHKDDNNKWLIKYYDKDEIGDGVEFVKNGDLIRLEHQTTRRNLHSHREPAPLSTKQLQVTGYGENGTGDANDVWKVVIEKGHDGEIVETVKSKLRLVHFLQQCVLTASSKQLPKWAYEQQEVSCNPNLRDPNALWNVEYNYFPTLPTVSFTVHAPGFFERFLESHAVMLQGNAGLKPKEGEVTSRPWQWPLNYRGQFFSGNMYKIYLLGNPIVWWGNLLFLPLALLLLAYDAIIEKRRIAEIDPLNESRRRTTQGCRWLFLGWILHYLPFWAMGRILYFHHYFPALYFSSMLSGVTSAYLLKCLPYILPDALASTARHTALAFLVSVSCYSFYLFSPLAYGITNLNTNESTSVMHSLRWLDTWEF